LTKSPPQDETSNGPAQRLPVFLGVPMRRRACIAIAGSAVLFSLTASPSLADSKLEARYVATLAGIPIGSGTWMIDVGENRYLAAASGSTIGLLRVFIGGQGTSAARGTFAGAKAPASTYAATISTIDKTSAVRLTIADGNVKESKVDPPIDHDPERIPLTKAHEQGVLDPMTASLVKMPGNGDPIAPDACNRTLSIFDGRLRYDLAFAYKRMEHVHAEKGYSGPVVVCSVQFTPVAGFIPSRTAIRYLA
jgi:hypothetical protein